MRSSKWYKGASEGVDRSVVLVADYGYIVEYVLTTPEWIKNNRGSHDVGVWKIKDNAKTIESELSNQ